MQSSQSVISSRWINKNILFASVCFGVFLFLGVLWQRHAIGKGETQKSALESPTPATKSIEKQGRGKYLSAKLPSANPADVDAAGRKTGWHAVYSLGDNRLLAHLIRDEGLLIALGHPGVAKYLNFGRPWHTFKLHQLVKGTRAAIATRTVSWLHVPLTAEQTRSKVIQLRIFSPQRQAVRLLVNKTALEVLKLESGWQLAALKLPEKILTDGENTLEFRWGGRGKVGAESRAYAGLDFIFLGKHPLPRTTNAPYRRDAWLFMPKNGGIAYYIEPYRGAKLRLHVKATPRHTSCQLRIKLLREGKAPIIESPRLGFSEKKEEVWVDLQKVALQATRLEVTARGENCSGMQLVDGEILMPGPSMKVRRGPSPKNVLFWLIDNARADRFKFYNPSTYVETPVISSLVKQGTLFEQAYVAGTESRVSHGSIWTGVFPTQTRFIEPKAKLPSGFVTMPEAIKKAGLYTACWVANGNISRFWGFAEGWDYFKNTLHSGGGLNAKRLAEHAIQFIQERGDKRFFLYIGTIDPHVSWRGQQPWLDKYDPSPYRGKYVKNVMGPTWDRLAGNPRQVSQRDRRRIQAIYGSTISYNDHQLGRVLKALEEKGIRDQTMVVVTADHGEEFWEYGRIGHGGSCRDHVVEVPLIIDYPPLFGRGVRVHEGVDTIALMATILDALGAPIPRTVQAASLMPLAQGVGAGYPRPRYATQYGFVHAMRLENFKLSIGGKGAPKLYNMRSQAEEHRDVSAVHPFVTRQLVDALSTFMLYQSQWRQSRWGVANNHFSNLPRDLEEGTAPPPISPR